MAPRPREDRCPTSRPETILRSDLSITGEERSVSRLRSALRDGLVAFVNSLHNSSSDHYKIRIINGSDDAKSSGRPRGRSRDIFIRSDGRKEFDSTASRRQRSEMCLHSGKQPCGDISVRAATDQPRAAHQLVCGRILKPVKRAVFERRCISQSRQSHAPLIDQARHQRRPSRLV
jgi:hypothetical protein